MWDEQEVNLWLEEEVDSDVSQEQIDEERRLEAPHLLPIRLPRQNTLPSMFRKFSPALKEQASLLKAQAGKGLLLNFDDLFPVNSEFCPGEDVAEFAFDISVTKLKRILHLPHSIKDVRKFGFLLCTKEVLRFYLDSESKKLIGVASYMYKIKTLDMKWWDEKYSLKFIVNSPFKILIYRKVKGVQREVYSKARDEYNLNYINKKHTYRGKDKSKRVVKAELFSLPDGTQITANEYAIKNNVTKRTAYRRLTKLNSIGDDNDSVSIDR